MRRPRSRLLVVAGLGAAAVIVALAAGCGGSEESTGTATETAAATTGTTTTTPTSALRAALVADAGQLNDNGFNELAYKGLKRAERELGIKGRVVEAQSAADYIPNMSTLARQGYDLVIGVGFAQGAAIAAVAKRFPQTDFAIVDVDQASLKGKPKNVQGLLFREEQVGYLVGYLGALSAKRAGKESISAVGGFKEPPVDRYIAGYRAGAEKAVPGTKVVWGYSQDWEDQAKCKELALNQIAAGSKVVFQVAGGCGLGALSAAKDRGVWGIGVDGDQSFLGPHVLTSALKGVDSAVFLTIKSLEDGTFAGGKNRVFGIDQEGVGLGKLSPKANKQDVAATEKVEQQLASGEITGIPTTVK
jgi:basic membrane protein A and related proteins